jgi:hypothetical protein
MSRHLLGLRAGSPGGRRWRRALSELADGRSGLATLHEIAAELGGVAATDAAYRGAVYAFG